MKFQSYNNLFWCDRCKRSHRRDFAGNHKEGPIYRGFKLVRLKKVIDKENSISDIDRINMELEMLHVQSKKLEPQSFNNITSRYSRKFKKFRKRWRKWRK